MEDSTQALAEGLADDQLFAPGEDLTVRATYLEAKPAQAEWSYHPRMTKAFADGVNAGLEREHLGPLFGVAGDRYGHRLCPPKVVRPSGLSVLARMRTALARRRSAPHATRGTFVGHDL